MRKRVPLKRVTRSIRDGFANRQEEPQQQRSANSDAEQGQQQQQQQQGKVPGLPSISSDQPISENLQQNKKELQQLFSDCTDIVFREARLVGGTDMLLVYVDGLVNSGHVEDVILKPLMYGVGVIAELASKPTNTMDDVKKRLVAIGQLNEVCTLKQGIELILTGETLLLIDGFEQAITLSVKSWEHRTVSEPDTEAVIRGPREGFVESIRTNTALVRRRIRTSNLKTEGLSIGSITKTDVAFLYIQGIAEEGIVNEVRQRLSKIQIDGVLDSGYIEDFIEDEPFSPFPQVQPTERPDTAVASLLEGRCVVIVDGSPFALILPVNLWGSLQASEDYYERFLFATLIRWLRLVFVIIALTLPSLYVAITTFHQEMLPTNLLLSIAAARESTPFPALVEALIMEVTFEALREAGVRLPKTVGQAVSIVGALVIGQSAVQAGIVSAPMVIVVSITGIANFTIPRYSFGLGIRMLRFPLMFLAGTFGLYGIVIGLIAIIIHISSLRSVGVPFAGPVAPLHYEALKDTFVRAPWWALNKRPRMFSKADPIRIPYEQRPRPPKQSSNQKGGGA